MTRECPESGIVIAVCDGEGGVLGRRGGIRRAVREAVLVEEVNPRFGGGSGGCRRRGGEGALHDGEVDGRS